MGCDTSPKVRKVRRTAPKSRDPYIRLLVKLYKFLARRTGAKFNEIVLKRLCMSKINRPPLSLRKLINNMSHESRKDKIAVVVGAVTNDIRVYEVPKMTVCALRFTKGARERILAAGGETITFDQLATRSPRGKNTVMVQGSRKAREACKHFGAAPGQPHSHTRPYIRSKGRKFEKARGRRSSRGYKK
ncbi:60S ribosomal protein L18 [Fragariocoptes setiger]|uniref:Large ribosomal subunit protein eL18 n=1 Tax=Fragariocoptes setiger TaxID=1670756 RepID=A0ABQ7S5W0_9ACAR|nr:60S ribosomal protein L18 [Fragariocoptes setiger]